MNSELLQEVAHEIDKGNPMKIKELITHTSTIDGSNVLLHTDDNEWDEKLLCSDDKGWFFEYNGQKIYDSNDLPDEIIGLEFRISHDLEL